MNKFSKILLASFSFLFIFSFLVVNVEAKNNDVNIYFFTGEGCPHCAQMKEYLQESLSSDYDEENIKIYEFEVYKNRQNALMLKEAAETLDAQVSGVPFLIIGDETYIGFSETMTPKTVNDRIDYCLSNNCSDSVKNILLSKSEIEKEEEVVDNVIVDTETENYIETTEEKEALIIDNTLENIEIESDGEKEPLVIGNVLLENKELIEIPGLGEIDPKAFSLPLLTIVIGVLDGFNPCAMWVLIFLISLLINIKDKKRMWILGSTFIVASSFVYFLFMSAWLNLIMFLGLILWVRILIGVLALGGGVYSLRDYFVNKEAACKVTGNKKRRFTFENLKKAVQQKNLWLALIGIITLAFAVNLVELFCSAGLPAVYTQILALNDVSSIGKYLYILLYIFFFMIDDLIVFIIAMTTLHITGISTKYSRFSRLIGGILMLLIGILLIYRPEWLMFG